MDQELLLQIAILCADLWRLLLEQLRAEFSHVAQSFGDDLIY